MQNTVGVFSQKVSCGTLAKWFKHSSNHSNESVKRERLAWQAIAICLVNEHNPDNKFASDVIIYSTDGGWRLCVHPSLSVWEQDILKGYGWIRTKLGGQVECVKRTN